MIFKIYFLNTDLYNIINIIKNINKNKNKNKIKK